MEGHLIMSRKERERLRIFERVENAATSDRDVAGVIS